jgi:hypothetical protein
MYSTINGDNVVIIPQQLVLFAKNFVLEYKPMSVSGVLELNMAHVMV